MEVKFKEWLCNVEKHKYSNGRLALRLTDIEDGSPIATATINIPEYPLGEGFVIVKDYSENEGMLDALTKAGIVQHTGGTITSGYITAPICIYTGD